MDQWVWTTLGVTLALAGLTLGAWALFWDRSRGRKRCPRCWYSMEGLPESQRGGTTLVVCPECGKELREARTLFRTRRRYRWSVPAALLLGASYLTIKIPAWGAGGWTALVPTTVLVVAAPTDQSVLAPRRPRGGFGPGPATAPVPPTIGDTLALAAWRRLAVGEMARWQSEYFISRFLRGLDDSVSKYVDVPDRWLIGEPIPVFVTQPLWARLGGGHLALAGSTTVDQTGGSVVSMLPACTKGPLGITLEVRVPTGVVYSRDVVVPMELVPDPLDLVKPVDSIDDSGRVREALNLRVVNSFGELLILAEDRNDDPRWKPLDFRIAYRIEIVFDGHVLGTAAGVADGLELAWRNWGVLHIDWKPDGEALVRRRPDAARLVVTGDPLVLMRQYGTWPFHGPPPAAWTGRFEIARPVEEEFVKPGY